MRKETTRLESLEELIDHAGDTYHTPPTAKIPRQWLPSIIRWPIRLLIYPFVLLDLAMQSLAKKMIKPPYRKVGKCKRRGNCCYYVLLPLSKGFLKYLDEFWATQIHGFFLRSRKIHHINGKRVYVMGCRYLKKDGKCGIYPLRPMICRTWPIIEIFGRPQVLKGCGYRPDPDPEETEKHHPLHVLQ